MKPEVQEALDAKKKRISEEGERERVVRHGICPDCAGELGKAGCGLCDVFLSRATFICTRCARRHIIYYDDV